MTHPLFGNRSIILLIILTIVISACSTLTGSAPSVPPQETVIVTAEATFGSGTFVLNDPRVGLSDLASYTATLTLSFDGTKDGKAQKWTKTYVMQVSKDPQARQLTLQRSGDLANLDPVNMAEREGMDYSWQGENTCTGQPIQQGDALGDRLEPAGFLSFVIGAAETGTEKMNGIASTHYTFDEHALGQENLTQSKGEMWVATDGGYVVKYLLSSTGKADYFGEGIEGTLTQDYELTDVGKAMTIDVPGDCPPGLVDAPQLPDATNVDSSPGLLTYESSTKMAEASAFYQKGLPKLGWKPSGKPAVADSDTLLDFAKGNETLTIVLATKADKTDVTLMLGSVPKQ